MAALEEESSKDGSAMGVRRDGFRDRSLVKPATSPCDEPRKFVRRPDQRGARPTCDRSRARISPLRAAAPALSDSLCGPRWNGASGPPSTPSRRPAAKRHGGARQTATHRPLWVDNTSWPAADSDLNFPAFSPSNPPRAPSLISPQEEHHDKRSSTRAIAPGPL
jgi:hypothetical protein